MAGQKRRGTIGEGTLTRPKHARTMEGLSNNQNVSAGVSAGQTSPRTTRSMTQALRIPYSPTSGPTGYLGAFGFAKSTDIDLNPDISIADERQTMRIRKKLDLGWCRVCVLPCPVTFMNYPCGHMTNCVKCNPHMEKCCLCQATIMDTVHCPEYRGRFFFSEWFGSRSSY